MARTAWPQAASVKWPREDSSEDTLPQPGGFNQSMNLHTENLSGLAQKRSSKLMPEKQVRARRARTGSTKGAWARKKMLK